MTRKMRRFKQQITDEEVRVILREQWRGVLALQGDDDYPYALPINFYYDEEKGCIYFHGAKEGYKIDAIRRNPKACFCVLNDGTRDEGDWALRISSVIVTGKMREVTDAEEHDSSILAFAEKYYPDEESARAEVAKDGARAHMLALTIESMTGKKVHEK